MTVPARPHAIDLPRTIAAVRQALPEAEREEFTAVIDSVNVAELPHTFEFWFRRAAVNQVPGLRARIAAGRGSGTGDTVPFEEAFPDANAIAERRRTTA